MARTLPILVAAACVLLSGCFHQASPELWVEVSPLAQYRNPAKPLDCDMEVLLVEPVRRYTKIAIVEGWADENEHDKLINALRRRACKTGADALLVSDQRGQSTPLHLYRATPNDLSEEVSSGANLEPGYYLHKEEHIPKIGEPGHSGFYIDATAIVYDRSGITK